MKLVCTSSRVKSFTVGNKYESRTVEHYGIVTHEVDGDTACGWVINDGLSICGADHSNPMATFRKDKSMMKMLVRAFVLVAKARGWGDSKNGAYKSWSGTPYKNSRDWARAIAFSYDAGSVAREIIDEDPNVKFIDQEAVNLFAENEIDNW